MKMVPAQQQPAEPGATAPPADATERRASLPLGDPPPFVRGSWGRRLRRLLYRNTVAALIATAVDFLMYSGLVATGHVSPPLATALGCVLGAIVNFSINRAWTFESRESTGPQLVRYAAVSASGAGLNSGGVALLLRLTAWDYRVSWLVTRLAVSWGWNLPLQRFFVFAARKARH
jgi:putative flippase GtrA